MTDASWEVLSNQALAAAGVVYFLALLCHLVEWAALLGKDKQRAAAPELVAAGQAGPDTVAADSTEGGTTEATGSGPDLDHRRAFFGRLGLLLTIVATCCHGVSLVGRGMAADPNRVPWGNMYEFTVAGTFVLSVAYLALYRKFKLAWLAPLVLIFNLACLMIAVIWLYDPVAPLTEALNSYWLVIHVVSAVIATGAFSLAGLLSIVYLLKLRKPGATTGLLAHVPSTDVLERTSYRIHAFAFPVWTFAVLITGPIWAHEAWSRYWNWDPKEVWAFITWVVYAGYLHARATGGWRGRNAAWISLIGLASLWYSFIGVNFFNDASQHSYAGSLPAPTTAVVQTVDQPLAPAPTANL
ncbi:c-type cytochrome biogenesis protein CcsB [Nocardioides insulae]|uniref:c-type cytochrome biogenesis protein CcsB n=1 Tax=Nocardioides insulae TaxID=394734 RepID=UPI0004296838|nr:c-type cytochrome biogenesis protein CcsB [Nocardioides insulae]